MRPQCRVCPATKGYLALSLAGADRETLPWSLGVGRSGGRMSLDEGPTGSCHLRVCGEGSLFGMWARCQVHHLHPFLEGHNFGGVPGGSAGKESACNTGDLGLIPGLGRSPGEGNGYPLQYSGLENSKDCVWGHTESDPTEQLFTSTGSSMEKNPVNAEAMQETRIQPLILENPPCLRAAKPMSHSY